MQIWVLWKMQNFTIKISIRSISIDFATRVEGCVVLWHSLGNWWSSCLLRDSHFIATSIITIHLMDCRRRKLFEQKIRNDEKFRACQNFWWNSGFSRLIVIPLRRPLELPSRDRFLELRDEFWWHFNYFPHQSKITNPSLRHFEEGRKANSTPTQDLTQLSRTPFLDSLFHDYFYWSLIITETYTWCFLPLRNKAHERRRKLNNVSRNDMLLLISETLSAVERLKLPSVKHVR